MIIYTNATTSWSHQPIPSEEDISKWTHASTKSNWRITQISNGFYQTEIKIIDTDKWRDITRRHTEEEAELAIDNSVAYYTKKLEYANGPKIIKTF